MKRFSKVLAVALTLFTLCIAPLFAQDGDKLVVTSNVPSMEPVFGIQGSFDETSWTDGTQAGAEMHCKVDITQKPTGGVNVVNVYLKVFQTNQSRFKGKYSISVTATPFENTDTGMEGYKTDDPSWHYNRHTTETVGLEITPTTTETAGVGSYKAAVTYTTGSPVAQGTEIFAVAYGWRCKENLPAGNYKATVTLSVSSP